MAFRQNDFLGEGSVSSFSFPQLLPGGIVQYPAIIFYIIAGCISVGSILIAVGMLKGKIHHNAEVNKAQDEQMKKLASRDELATAIKRSDDMLALMKERAEEDRAKGQGQYREFYGMFNGHEKRISALETQQTGLAKTLDELKKDIREVFRRI